MSRSVDDLPRHAGELFSLEFAQEIDGVPAQEFFDQSRLFTPTKRLPPPTRIAVERTSRVTYYTVGNLTDRLNTSSEFDDGSGGQ